MKHLIIKIDLPINDSRSTLTEYEANEAAKQAYKAARNSLPQFTSYNEEDFDYEIEF